MLVAGDPDAAVRGAVGEELRIFGLVAEDVDDTEDFPSGLASSLDVSLRPVLVGKEAEAAGHYRPGRRLSSASLAAPSAAMRSASAKSASISLLWSL